MSIDLFSDFRQREMMFKKTVQNENDWMFFIFKLKLFKEECQLQ